MTTIIIRGYWKANQKKPDLKVTIEATAYGENWTQEIEAGIIRGIYNDTQGGFAKVEVLIQ